MSHPHNEHRAHHKERSRVGHITGGHFGASKTGSAHLANRLRPTDEGLERKAWGERDSQAVEGGSVKERFDRPGRSLRARGGRTKGKTVVNVNILGGAGAGGAGVASTPAPRPVPPPAPAPAPMAGPPAGAGVAPPAGMMPGGLPPGAPLPMGGMPPRPGMPMRARGGRTGTKVWREGVADGTQMQNNPAGKNDQRDVNRGKPITYANGGAVDAAKAKLQKTMSLESKSPPNSRTQSVQGNYASQIEDSVLPPEKAAGGAVRACGGPVPTSVAKRRASGGAVHYFGCADMGIPHPFKGKDFSTPMKAPNPKKGPNDPPGEGKMPSDKAVMHSAAEARGHGHASIGKGPFALGTMGEPKPKSGPKEHPKGIAGYNVKGGAGGARARMAKIKKYGP